MPSLRIRSDSLPLTNHNDDSYTPSAYSTFAQLHLCSLISGWIGLLQRLPNLRQSTAVEQSCLAVPPQASLQGTNQDHQPNKNSPGDCPGFIEIDTEIGDGIWHAGGLQNSSAMRRYSDSLVTMPPRIMSIWLSSLLCASYICRPRQTSRTTSR